MTNTLTNAMVKRSMTICSRVVEITVDLSKKEKIEFTTWHPSLALPECHTISAQTALVVRSTQTWRSV